VETDARKKLFAEHLLNYVPVIGLIKRVLDERPSHSAPIARVRNELEDYMSEEYADETLRTIVSWGPIRIVQSRKPELRQIYGQTPSTARDEARNKPGMSALGRKRTFAAENVMSTPESRHARSEPRRDRTRMIKESKKDRATEGLGKYRYITAISSTGRTDMAQSRRRSSIQSQTDSQSASQAPAFP
jgi:hypothetical protein